MQEKENILRIFKEAKSAIEREDVVKLKQLSNETIHTASITQDPDNIAVAVIVYSLSKMIERNDYRSYSGWNKFYAKILALINSLISSLKRNNDVQVKNNLEAIRSLIEKLTGSLKRNIKDVFRKASINKASRIYEHGISMEKTAKLLGITLWELASYIGQTGISDVPLSRTSDVKSRIKLAMDLFS